MARILHSIAFAPILVLAMVSQGGLFTSSAHAVSPVVSEEAKTESWVGVLEKTEATTYQYGTHALRGHVVDGSRDPAAKPVLFALTSDTVKLDDFNGKKVIIKGFKIKGYPVEGGPEYIRVTAVEEVPPAKDK